MSSELPDILKADYFQLFGVPVDYDCDAASIRGRYRELQQAVHPDRFVNAGDHEKRVSMQQTARLNEAFDTLKDPVRRALYMMELSGHRVDFDNETTMDMSFLMEQMELRERMADLRSLDDPLAEVDNIGTDLAAGLDAMKTSFKAYHGSSDHEQARETIRKMQFLQKAKRELDDIAAAIEDELMG